MKKHRRECDGRRVARQATSAAATGGDASGDDSAGTATGEDTSDSESGPPHGLLKATWENVNQYFSSSSCEDSESGEDGNSSQACATSAEAARRAIKRRWEVESPARRRHGKARGATSTQGKYAHTGPRSSCCAKSTKVVAAVVKPRPVGSITECGAVFHCGDGSNVMRPPGMPPMTPPPQPLPAASRPLPPPPTCAVPKTGTQHQSPKAS